MRRNAARDGIRYARVPMGGETCTFCAMLASRGFAYKSASAAGEGNHWHPNCRCKVVPSTAGRVEGYDPDEWSDRWHAMEEVDADPRITAAQKLETKASIARSTPLDAGVRSMVDGMVAKSAEPIRGVWEKYRRSLVMANPRRQGTARYVRGAGVEMDLAEDIAGSFGRPPLTVYFHENGHQIDWLAGGDGFLSARYNGGEFGRTIREEAAGLVAERRAPLAAEASRLANALDVDGLLARGYIEEGMADFYRGVISRLDSDVALYNLYRVPALKGADREAREAFLRDVIAKDGNVRDSVTRRAMDAIENEVGSMGSAEKNALSDILEGTFWRGPRAARYVPDGDT